MRLNRNHIVVGHYNSPWDNLQRDARTQASPVQIEVIWADGSKTTETTRLDNVRGWLLQNLPKLSRDLKNVTPYVREGDSYFVGQRYDIDHDAGTVVETEVKFRL